MASSARVGSVLGLDVGQARIGVALARLDVRLPQPQGAIPNDDHTMDAIRRLVAEHDVQQIVVGWPRGLDGQTTGQTKASEAFADDVRQATGIPVALQDEAMTSQKAEAELQSRGKSYAKGDIDALAATYIVEDYLGV